MQRAIGYTLAGILVFVAGWYAWYSGRLAFLFANYPERTPIETVAPNPDPLIVARRADSIAAPENTLPAIEAAIAGGADFVELDVRLTADGVPVLMHDAKLDRTTDGEGPITGAEFAVVEQLDAGSWFGEEFRGTAVPTLEQALSTALNRVCVLAHIKAEVNRKLVLQLKAHAKREARGCVWVTLGGRKGNDTSWAEGKSEEVQKLVEANSRRSAALFFRQWHRFRRYWPDFPYARQLLKDDDLDELVAEFPELIAVQVSLNALSEETVRKAHAKGIIAFSLTMQDEDEMYARLVDAGVDAVFLTDYQKLQRFLRRRAATGEMPADPAE